MNLKEKKKQNYFLNQWMISVLKDKRSCSHKIITEITENRFNIYVRCADCGRIIKLKKEVRQ